MLGDTVATIVLGLTRDPLRTIYSVARRPTIGLVSLADH